MAEMNVPSDKHKHGKDCSHGELECTRGDVIMCMSIQRFSAYHLFLHYKILCLVHTILSRCTYTLFCF